MKKIVVFLVSLFLFLPLINAEDKYINVYLFHSNTCPHCKQELAWFDEYLKNHSNVRLYEYEISNSENMTRYYDVQNILNYDSNGVPFLVIGNDVVIGFSDSLSSRIETLINHYLTNNYEDEIGKYLGVSVYESKLEGVPDKDVTNDDEVLDNSEQKEQENTVLNNYDVPILGEINAKSVSLPLLAVVMGFVDGFNPCALWILIFLISMLFGMNDRKKMWILGLTFLITSGLVYLLFMVSWLNLAVFVSSVDAIRIMIAAFATIFGVYNIYNFFKNKNSDVGCTVTNDKSRKKIMEKIKVILAQKYFVFSLIGIILLAVSVNVLQLLCSLGLPVIFTQVLALNNLSVLEYSIYILIYILLFMLDDIVIFFVAMKTLQIKGISNKYTKYSHLIGGVIMIIIGLLMLFKPEWLMFNF